MIHQLTPMQQKIIHLMIKGLKPKKIADELSISREIVYLHLANARKQLNSHSSIELLHIVNGERNIDYTVIKLSPRGEDVFKFIIQGLSEKQISNYLGISRSTVRRHKEKIF